TGKASIVITVPSSAPAVRLGAVRNRGPAYVSVATKAMTIAFRRGGKLKASTTVALLPGAKGCTASSSGTTCRVTIALDACPRSSNCYLANVSTYDAVKCTSGKPRVCTIPPRAHVLSTENRYPVGIFPGQNTRLALALSGVPVSASIVPADGATKLNASGAFDLLGLGAHVLAVEFFDAHGAAIVGVGSPTLSVTPPTGSLSPVTVTTPSAGANEITVTPPSAFNGTATATFTVAPSFAGQATNGCLAPGAKCTPISVTVDMVKLLAISNGGLQLYALGDTSPVSTLDGGDYGLATDPAGNLYTGAFSAANDADNLVVFSPPLTDSSVPTVLPNVSHGKPPARNFPGFPTPTPPQLTTVQPVSGYGAVASFYYPDSGISSTDLCSNTGCVQKRFSGGSATSSAAANAEGDLAFGYTGSYCEVALGSGATIQPANAPPCAQSLAFDPSGNVFFTIPNGYEVMEASKSSGYATLTTISTGTSIPYRLTIDPSGNVLCAGQDALSLDATLQYIAASTLSANQGGTVNPDRAITIASPPSGQSTASEVMAIDSGLLYVEYSFRNGSTGNLATYSLPNLTQVGMTQTNEGVSANGIAIVP
ncbi:MAG TPA: hypothetical protein VK760_05115, partial [Candidatus Acidoferrales bacterium]|nr:hypothetical protein [Candidatus Acidoferrales bacterium]